jgi:hypothetical protein
MYWYYLLGTIERYYLKKNMHPKTKNKYNSEEAITVVVSESLVSGSVSMNSL